MRSLVPLAYRYGASSALSWAIMASYHMMNGAFYGSGSTRLAMGIGVTTLWGVRALAAVLLVLVFNFGATGVWYAIALSNVTAAITGALFFFRGHWLKDVLSDGSAEDATQDVDRTVTD